MNTLTIKETKEVIAFENNYNTWKDLEEDNLDNITLLGNYWKQVCIRYAMEEIKSFQQGQPF